MGVKWTKEYTREYSIRYSKKHYLANKEQINSRQREKYRTDPEFRKRGSDRVGAWYIANKERARERSRRNYLKNKKHIDAKGARWRENKQNRDYKNNVDKKREGYKRKLHAAYIKFYLGAICTDCGKKCVPAFHHVNSKDKLFNISEGISIVPEKFEAELVKCILLCQPCHARGHSIKRRKLCQLQ